MNEREKMQHAELDRIKRMLLENPEKLGPDGAHRRATLRWLDDEVAIAENFEVIDGRGALDPGDPRLRNRSHLKVIK